MTREQEFIIDQHLSIADAATAIARCALLNNITIEELMNGGFLTEYAKRKFAQLNAPNAN